MTIVTHLKSLQALELAVRSGSLTAAAEILTITPAAVGQRIKSLEDYLGLELVARSRSGITPTRTLEAAMPHLRAAFGELDKSAEILDFSRLQEIHIAADTDWFELWLRPRLEVFKSANPNALFCINGTGDVLSRPGRPDCEIWFRQGRGGAETVLFHDYLLPVGSPDTHQYLSKHPLDTSLDGHPLLHLTWPQAVAGAIGWPEWSHLFGHRKIAPERGVRYTRAAPALESVRGGAGIMLCGLALVLDDLDAGTVLLPFDIHEGAWRDGAYRLALRDGAAKKPQIARFRDWLVAEAADTQARLCDMTGSAPQ